MLSDLSSVVLSSVVSSVLSSNVFHCHRVRPKSPSQHSTALAQLAGSLEGPLQFADHIDKVLTDRADMFLKMRDGLRVLKEKARAAAYPKPSGGAAPALD